jgi:DNA-directed RNA polymerase subunit RPC12/RpoP
MACPACGLHILFAAQSLGQQLPCPQCNTTVTLRKPDLLKTVCFFCKGHIEFPTHAIGEKIPCPHCKMDITLRDPA